MRGTGLEFCPPRANVAKVAATRAKISSHLIMLNKQQSAFIAGASREVMDAFSNEEIYKLEQ